MTAFTDLNRPARVGAGVFFTLCIAIGAFTFGWFASAERQPLERLTRPDCIVWK
jgi:hypothetical protein